MKVTKDDFAEAFLMLVEQHSGIHFSVDELAQKAGYTRVTFYNNFKNYDDLLNYIHNEIQSEIFRKLTATPIEEWKLADLLDVILPELYLRRDKLKTIYRKIEDASWIDYLVDKYWPWAESYFMLLAIEPHLYLPKLLFTYDIKVLTAIISNWILLPDPPRPDEVKGRVLYLMTHSISSISGFTED